VKKHADQFHDLHGKSFGETLEHVRRAAIDVLIDLAGATSGALPELFAHRAAPVQASYLGFPGTSGSGLVDYLLCDSVCVPGTESDAYAEALARLPDTFWICDPGAMTAAPSRESARLPTDAVVLYAHHPGQKISPGIFAAWMEILKAVPYAVLWLLDDRPGMAANLQRVAEGHGVRPYRLIFAPRVPYAEYRARIPLADLALDTPVYNGGATTLDALACGVPVLTMAGQGFAARMAASALTAAGLPDLIATSPRDYVSIAVQLARRRDELDALKERVRGARESSKLFDTRARVRELETAYRLMYERAHAGLAPASFNL
jgi:predicted O-linked N-acetylglucosamine transferase (SPINDLY family)